MNTNWKKSILLGMLVTFFSLIIMQIFPGERSFVTSMLIGAASGLFAGLALKLVFKWEI